MVLASRLVMVSNSNPKLARDIANGLFVGEPLLAVYGYVADGLFVDQDDVDSYEPQPTAAEPGYIRYKDIGGPDGTGPDGVVQIQENIQTYVKEHIHSMLKQILDEIGNYP